MINYIGLQAISACLYRILLNRLIPLKSRPRAPTTSGSPHRRIRLAHTALNISLFPPLFFFCALFYTDILSVLFVLSTFLAYDARRPLLMILCGLVSLMFRQTNVFWVAIHLSGKETLRILERQQSESDESTESASLYDILDLSMKRGSIFDPTVKEARLQGSLPTCSFFTKALKVSIDYFKCALSLVLSMIVNTRRLIFPLLPYITILAAFGAFVLWNGGVVLGESSGVALVRNVC